MRKPKPLTECERAMLLLQFAQLEYLERIALQPHQKFNHESVTWSRNRTQDKLRAECPQVAEALGLAT